ncbi:efflux RND transporter periplasmic adaptor subunit [Aeoliella mucimassa]|uniref:HlyD family secretion protein n=1 Tax=Aeoliella mucimassa TaxID=2527972 RepID=A0A518AI13_9BACT|nr:efflux RND transporter periplasmic adaptor subunit [Aeoliella mucimassa]QDU54367.1 HlyD family secretion protein [Aeoliella mucimassa]
MRSTSSDTSDAPSTTDQAVWDDLSLVLDQVDDAARTAEAPSDFYRAVLAKMAPLLAASRGAVWIVEASQAVRPIAHTSTWLSAIADHEAHQALVSAAIASTEVLELPPGASIGEATNPTPDYLLLAPVTLAEWTHHQRGVVAVVELALPAGRAPSSYRGSVELLRTLTQVAAEYHVRRELLRLGTAGAETQSLLTFAERIGGHVDLQRTAMAIANEGGRVIACDRISVLTASSRSARLWATSGTDHVERRGRAARALEQLATMAVKLGEPIDYTDHAGDDAESLPQVAEVLGRYVDEFHARSLIVMPVPMDDEQAERTSHRGVLVVEQFASDSTPLNRMHVAELARAAAPALSTSLAWHELPLGGLLQTIGWLRMPRTLFRLSAAVLVIAAVATALWAIPAPMTVDVRGRLVPTERQEVFAPRSGLVDRLDALHGESVTAGQVLVALRDPELAIEIERLAGERQQLARQLESVRATRTTADVRQRDPLELYRLSAEEEELKTKLENLTAEQTLLEQQAKSLVVTSPLTGQITTWQVEERLALGRPVERGQVLVSVANTAGDWQLELDLPDERLDLLRTADDWPLQVEYRLGSDSSALHHATVTRIADRVEHRQQPTGGEAATVTIEATPTDELPAELREAALRPGGTLRARIVVGKRSLGYVLTSDLWRAVCNWWEF